MSRHLTLSKALTAILLFMGIAFGQSAFAESAWTINSSYNPSTHKTKFSIKRSEYIYPQTVLYRTVGLSAYPGQHYTAVSGELNFAANDSIKEIEVTERTPTDLAYMFQSGNTRTYCFEVTDKGGFVLASKQRDIPFGTSVSSSSSTVFGDKELPISSGTITVTDGGYAQAYHSVNVNNYYSASASKNYFTAIGAQLRMTVTFDAREEDDGYQYIAIYANTNTGNVDTGAKDGDPGTIYYSRYMAGFTIDGNVSSTYYPYTFPLTSKGDACGAVTHPWPNNSNGNLEQQYFNTNCRATDGRLIIPTDLSSLYVRFNASGHLDDNWYAQNVKAHIQAVDNTAPTMKGIVADPGRHAKGNTVYVSVAFSEIMKVTGTPTLSVHWGKTYGTLDYTSGSGSNVLTFKGIIPQNVSSSSISITGYDGTLQDLAGNNFSGSISYTDLFSTNADLAYALSDFRQDDNHNYLITCHDDLRGLAGLVNNGGSTSGKTFRQVTNLTFPYSTQWNNSSSTENGFTCIGTHDYPFQGTYDGEGHSISGIRIYKDGSNYQGLFGDVSGTVKRVNLTDTRITGKSYVGGIAGETNSATIEECTVANNVCIHAVNTQSLSHGGVVGLNRGTVQSCISHATLSVTNTTNCSAYGGIAGRSSGSITDCLAIGATIPGVDNRGAILGYREGGGSLTCNYYLNCTVAGTANATNVGFNGTDYSNGNSARALYALTLGAYIAIDHDPSATLPGSGNITYDNGADINGQPYSYNMASLNLTYNGNLPTGYHAIFTATAGTVNGNTLTMPASAVTVSTDFVANTYSVRFNKNNTNATGTMANQGFTYGVTQPLNANNYSRTGYTFAGWNTQADGNGTFYTDQQSVSNLTPENGAIIDLYAQWTVIPEVTVSNSDQTVCLGDSIEDMIITATNGTITSVTGLPAGVEWSGTTISGTPTVSGTFNVTVTVCSDQTPDCGEETATATITVNPLPEVTVTNDNQTVCAGDAIVAMEITATNGTIANVEGLPAGLTWSGTMISGTPTVTGTFNVTVTVSSDQTPDCGEETATATITVNPLPEVTVTNDNQTVCLGDSIEDMIITATNGTITSVTGLPAGVEWSGTTISGTPTVSGTFNVTVTVSSDQTPDCGEETATATITVNPLPEVTVTNNVQTICMDNQIQEMEIIYSNGTIESVTGLPENVNWYDTPSGATIFGAPAEYGTFNATVTVTSDQGCGTATAYVTITVKPNPEVTVSNNFQTVCENSAITAMEITATHATIENVTGLPTGVSWSKDSSGATGTISGTPTASGTYNVTVTVNSDQTPSCGIAYAYVRITVNPLPEYTLDITGYGDSDGGWNLIASPLAESIAATEVGNLVAETAKDFDLYRFNQAANMEWENWKQKESEHYHFNLESGQGYLYASKEDVTLTFRGTPNSDDAVNVSLSYTEGKPLAGFNLVGNPFTVDAYVNRPFYKMNDAGTGIEAIENYNDYTTAQTIPACTGIVVKADNSGESVIFSTTAPSLSAPNNGNLQITLTQANTRGNALLDNAIVSFNEGSQLGKFYFGEQNGNIYIPQGGKEFAIAYSEGMGEMPLNFKARKNGEYTITVNPDNVEMSFLHLIDNLTGADVDLLQTPSYTFSARNDDYASRFKLVFKALGNSSETEEDFAFISNGEIIINGKGIVQVIDLMGRIILADEANRNISTKGFVSGVYVLRLIDGENAKTQKIVIQ